ncbi:capsular polysaccharide export system, ATP-binding protein [Campylobacter iguaniorum]|uniref:ABC transporter ATP-binding protein n=1 Tax=Campylobacter iguaniorum TaxID=1244531 RepID=UPI0007C89680|nr:ABC transporter ATP-binding protein [Campylobacter iguaniorum]ANE35943.1 capsular polysaccharide export system, ATP-binding protein [Campylobacter iguaniorum]
MIVLDNISKSYMLSTGRHYVFKNLSFTFPENCSIGLIGPNGAGKSTLMRILGCIDMPDSGMVKTNKTISWPVGLSGGLQLNLSARDNVKFVSRIYGFWGEDMVKKVKYVEDFAEIGRYFDQPISTLSSGMRSRVAFGLSMAFDFDYYLIDEARAVGDARFKKKSDAVYKEKLKNSNVIMVSHNMNDIKQWCDKVVLIEKGHVNIFDDVNEGIAKYKRVCN